MTTPDLSSLTAKHVQIVDNPTNPTKKYYPNTLAKYVTNNSGGNLGNVPADAEKNTIVTIKMNGSNLTPDANRVVDLGTVISSHQSLGSYYTKTETDSAISTAVANASHLKRSIVQSLPTASNADENTIYMILANDGATGDLYDEYILANNALEKIGSTRTDLTGYAQTSDLPTKLSDLTDDLMTSYAKASSVSAVSGSDSVRVAIGKLEKALDGKQASGSYASAVHTHTKSEITDFPNLATVATSGAYSDLTGKPTNVSSFTNDMNYLSFVEIAD